MIYMSHLVEDHEMQELIQKTGCGVESIECSDKQAILDSWEWLQR